AEAEGESREAFSHLSPRLVDPLLLLRIRGLAARPASARDPRIPPGTARIGFADDTADQARLTSPRVPPEDAALSVLRMLDDPLPLLVREAVDPPPDRPHRLLPGWRGCAPDRSRAVAERVTTLQRQRWFRRSGRGSGRDVHTKLGLVLPPKRQNSSAD